METAPKFRKDIKLNWYRCEVDPRVMSQLMQCSDFHGFRQALGYFGLWCATGSLSYLAFRNITHANWIWSVPFLLATLFVHGTVGSFMGGDGGHELSHKTVFKTKSINEFFFKLFGFFAWWDPVIFRPSHIRHHQVTLHNGYDGEVVLPQKFTFKEWRFWLSLFAWNPEQTWKTIQTVYRRATGRLDNEWFEFVLPQENEKLRRDDRNWARFTLIGHALLALLFITTGHWFLIFVFNFGTQYCGLLTFLCNTPQHFGLSPNVPDHRLCCRTFTCSWLTSFLYWNMQYHIEHHMFPAVPFYNLPKLHKAIENDLPATPHGLWTTWKGLLKIHREQWTNPDYAFVPELSRSTGTRADDNVLEREAALVS